MNGLIRCTDLGHAGVMRGMTGRRVWRSASFSCIHCVRPEFVRPVHKSEGSVFPNTDRVTLLVNSLIQ